MAEWPENQRQRIVIMETTETNQRWVGSREIMDRFSVSRSTVNRMVKKGLPCLWIGGHRRFNVAEVVEWLEEQR